MRTEEKSLRARFYVELVLGAGALILVAVTLVWNDWIELVFKVDPDAGDGSLEKTICLVLLLAAIASAGLARTEWRRARAAVAARP
jgi:hypothetical protein